MTTTPLPIVVLISGNGSNLQAIINAINEKHYPIDICAVISDQANAYGLQRASAANIATEIIFPADYPTRDAFDQQLQNVITNYQPQLIILAGFMRILSDAFIEHFYGKIINIHPSLLPKYPGLNTHKKVLAAGDKQHGCTIHFVNQQLDGGPIICYSQLTVKSTDTLDSLKSRVQQLEHQIYPQVIKWIAEQRLTLRDDRVVLDNKFVGSSGILLETI